jgi:hypothetical protein
MRWAGAATAVAALTIGTLAFGQASSPGVELAWSAPAQCPSRAAVLGEIQSILAGGAASTHAVQATAAVERDGPRWRVALSIRSDQGSGVRALDADSCAALASAVALIVALAVDPTRHALPASAPAAGGSTAAEGQRGAPPSPEQASTDAGAAASPPPPPPVPTARRREGEDADGPRLAVGAAATADFGTLPSAALGGAVMVAGLYRRARLEARGRAYVSQHAADPARQAQGVELAYLGGDARACLALIATERASREGLTISPCLGLDLSRISGSGFGGAKTFSGNGSWSAVEAGLLGTWAFASSVAIRVGLDLLVPTSRPAFVVLAPDGSTAGSLHRPAAIAGRFDFGVELRFW